MVQPGSWLVRRWNSRLPCGCCNFTRQSMYRSQETRKEVAVDAWQLASRGSCVLFQSFLQRPSRPTSCIRSRPGQRNFDAARITSSSWLSLQATWSGSTWLTTCHRLPCGCCNFTRQSMYRFQDIHAVSSCSSTGQLRKLQVPAQHSSSTRWSPYHSISCMQEKHKVLCSGS